tara:strand:- start:357 stop:824 length:468 start_codon:yes stop_codon:yes gene_type:complete
MSKTTLIHHFKGAPGLRLVGLGPSLWPSNGMKELKKLLDNHAFWAKHRNIDQLKTMLINSSEIISLWQSKRMIGFGRATSDGIYRAVLWDVVIANDLQGLGLGKLLVNALINTPKIQSVEKIYLMTTNSSEFYQQMGFKSSNNQELLIIDNKSYL